MKTKTTPVLQTLKIRQVVQYFLPSSEGALCRCTCENVAIFPQYQICSPNKLLWLILTGIGQQSLTNISRGVVRTQSDIYDGGL